jgi:phosphatidylglycerol:prolipoprotein diacylglycerol transferase
MGLSWGFAYHYCENKSSLTKKQFTWFMLGNFILSWVGSKIFFLLFSAGPKSAEYLESSNFWLGGGFVFYGGLIFCLLFTYLFLKFTKVPFTSLMHFVPAVAYAHGIGRIGCFLAGCCYGLETNNFLAVPFHDHMVLPTQLFESALCLFIGKYLEHLIKVKKNFLVLPTYLLMYGMGRFFLEFLRGDSVRGSFGGLASSQWVSIFMIVLASFLNLKSLRDNLLTK